MQIGLIALLFFFTASFAMYATRSDQTPSTNTLYIESPGTISLPPLSWPVIRLLSIGTRAVNAWNDSPKVVNLKRRNQDPNPNSQGSGSTYATNKEAFEYYKALF